jgi:hypothetical protein
MGEWYGGREAQAREPTGLWKGTNIFRNPTNPWAKGTIPWANSIAYERMWFSEPQLQPHRAMDERYDVWKT